MNYELVKENGSYYIKGLKTWLGETNTLLLIRHPEGDVDTIGRNGKAMHCALYDEFQTCNDLKDGDTFSIRGEVVYRCEGVHVVKVFD